MGKDGFRLPVLVCTGESAEFRLDMPLTVLVDVTPPLNKGADVVGTGTGRMSRGWFHVISPLAVRSPVFLYRVVTLDALRVLNDGVDEVFEWVRNVLELITVPCKWICGLVESVCVLLSGFSGRIRLRVCVVTH